MTAPEPIHPGRTPGRGLERAGHYAVPSGEDDTGGQVRIHCQRMHIRYPAVAAFLLSGCPISRNTEPHLYLLVY